MELPFSAWTEELIDQRPCMVIRNPNYCTLFWIHLWRTRIVDWFKRQRHYDKLENIDLKRTVIIDSESGALLSAPVSINSIEYFARARDPDSYFNRNVLLPGLGIDLILGVYIAVVCVLFTVVGFASYNNDKFSQDFKFLHRLMSVL